MSRPEQEHPEFDQIDREEHMLRWLTEQTNYSSVLLTEHHKLLTAVRRVDQKYGPYNEFAEWREGAGPMPDDLTECCSKCGHEVEYLQIGLRVGELDEEIPVFEWCVSPAAMHEMGTEMPFLCADGKKHTP